MPEADDGARGEVGVQRLPSHWVVALEGAMGFVQLAELAEDLKVPRCCCSLNRFEGVHEDAGWLEDVVEGQATDPDPASLCTGPQRGCGDVAERVTAFEA